MSAPKVDLYPTPSRKKLAADIEAGKVRWYCWREPWACHVPTNAKVTARVEEMERAGLVVVDRDPASRVDNYTLVRLTDAGREWAGIGAKEVSDVG